MQKKWLSFTLGFLLIGLSACSKESDQAKTVKDITAPVYTETIQLHLEARAAQLKSLLQSPEVVETLTAADHSDARDKGANIANYQALDQKMQNNRYASDVQELLHNRCARRLKKFQATHPMFAEIFITDLVGMNVCQSNMTSDFYQADELWWQKAIRLREGETLYGAMEYDESANVMAVPIYIPIYRNKVLIGISKSVLEIQGIAM